jgi:beta-lactam-binding protein with PASTA domain
VEDYRGRSIEEVRMEIQALFAASNHPQITLKEPFMYEQSKETAGTILQQRPEPGASLLGAASLEFVVSKGFDNAVMKTPDFLGLSLAAALEQISKTNVDFTFTMQPAQDSQKGEVIIAQSPLPGIEMETGTRITLTLAVPEPKNGEVTGLFKYAMPKNPYPLKTRLDIKLPSGERVTLLQTNFSGGDFVVPYTLPVGSDLILSMLDRELHREMVSIPAELLLEQL